MMFVSLLNGASHTLPLVVFFPEAPKTDAEINEEKKYMKGKLSISNIYKDQ